MVGNIGIAYRCCRPLPTPYQGLKQVGIYNPSKTLSGIQKTVSTPFVDTVDINISQAAVT